ncbi:hypothetical protein S245_018256 [Arachis hypogaea]
MDAEKKMVATFLKLCHSFTKEVEIPSKALKKFLIRVTSPTTTGDLQAFPRSCFGSMPMQASVLLNRKWRWVYSRSLKSPISISTHHARTKLVPFRCASCRKLMAPFKKSQIHDLNLLAPREDEVESSQKLTMRLLLPKERQFIRPIKVGAKGLSISNFMYIFITKAWSSDWDDKKGRTSRPVFSPSNP